MSFVHKKPNLFPLDLFARESLDMYLSRQKDYLTGNELQKYLGLPLGMVDMTTEGDRAENILMNHAVHVLVFQGRNVFEHEFINIDSNKNRGKILSDSQLQKVESLGNMIQNNSHVKILLKDGIAEGVLRAKYASYSCQIRLDWFNPYYGLVDLKIVDNLARFDWNAKAYRYYEQLALYRAVIREATHIIVPVFFIVVGKRDTKCRVFEVSNDLLNLTETFNRKNLARMENLRQPGQWEGLIESK